MTDQPDTKLPFKIHLLIGPRDIQDLSLQEQKEYEESGIVDLGNGFFSFPLGTALKAEEEDLPESPRIQGIAEDIECECDWAGSISKSSPFNCEEEEVRISDLYDKEKEREEAMEEMMGFEVTESTSPDKNGHLLKLVFDNDTDFHFEFSKEIKKKILSRCPPGHKYIYFNLAPREGKDSILSYLRDDEEEKKRFLSTYKRLCSEWNFFELFEDGGDKCYFEVWEDEREYFRFLKSTHMHELELYDKEKSEEALASLR